MTARFVDMRLVSCIELDLRTIQLTVFEQWIESRWRGLRVRETEVVKSYVLSVSVGRWLDGDHYVLKPDPRHFRLMELWAAWMAERKLDEYIGGGARMSMPAEREPRRGPLPPVPVLPAPRGTTRRLDS